MNPIWPPVYFILAISKISIMPIWPRVNFILAIFIISIMTIWLPVIFILVISIKKHNFNVGAGKFYLDNVYILYNSIWLPVKSNLVIYINIINPIWPPVNSILAISIISICINIFRRLILFWPSL